MRVEKHYIEERFEDLKQWYAIYTMPRSEKKVEERFVKKGVKTYLPLITSIRIWSDRKKKVKLPLIPGYLFIHAEQNQLAELYQIQGAIGVVRHVGKPAKVNPQELENIRILISEPDSFHPIESLNLTEGQRFEVTFGNFAGLSGTFLRQHGRHRAIISLESIGKQFEVNVPISFLHQTY